MRKFRDMSPIGMFAGGVVVALVITGGGAAAVAANGDSVLIGKTNVGTKKTVFKSGGSPVGFKSKTAAPFTVNNSRRVAGLNADKLDGVSGESFLRTTGKAADADKLDGVSSESFLRTTGKAADADKLDGLSSESFLAAGGKAADADKVDGISSESFALVSGATADVAANGAWVDLDSDGTPDALTAQATCPSGTRITGGGSENYTIYSTAVSAPAGLSWVVISLADFGIDTTTDVVSHAVCYNPRGAVPAGTNLGSLASGTTVADLKAKAAGALARR